MYNVVHKQAVYLVELEQPRKQSRSSAYNCKQFRERRLAQGSSRGALCTAWQARNHNTPVVLAAVVVVLAVLNLLYLVSDLRRVELDAQRLLLVDRPACDAVRPQPVTELLGCEADVRTLLAHQVDEDVDAPGVDLVFDPRVGDGVLRHDEEHAPAEALRDAVPLERSGKARSESVPLRLARSRVWVDEGKEVIDGLCLAEASAEAVDLVGADEPVLALELRGLVRQRLAEQRLRPAVLDVERLYQVFVDVAAPPRREEGLVGVALLRERRRGGEERRQRLVAATRDGGAAEEPLVLSPAPQEVGSVLLGS